MKGPAEVTIGRRPVGPLADLVGPERLSELTETFHRVRRSAGGRTPWQINPTATGCSAIYSISTLLEDPARAEEMGVAARDHVHRAHVGDTHLLRWTRLFADLAQL